MINIDLIRHHPESVRHSLRRREENTNLVDQILQLDFERRRLQVSMDSLRAERNARSKSIGLLLSAGGDSEQAQQEKLLVREVTEQLRQIGDSLQQADSELKSLMLLLPNLVDSTVPDGTSDADNIVVSMEGQTIKHDFELKPHWELAESLGITDFGRAAKISGRMFYVLGQTGARLQRALVNYMLDLHREHHGYEEWGLPFLVLQDALIGSSNLPKFADALYHDVEEDLWLIPTAEVPLTNLHRDEILPLPTLPKRYMAHTPCFRKERAAAGQQVRGLKRVHQFEKVEMYQFVEPSRSMEALESLVQAAADIVRGLELPFRILQICSADTSFASAKTYDLEIYAPASGEWLEVSSCSNCTDFQARRTNIRYREMPQSKPEFVHTLNGSGLAIPRVIIAILESCQLADGSVQLPSVLTPYMSGQHILSPVR